jgi:predicted methyltransferase
MKLGAILISLALPALFAGTAAGQDAADGGAALDRAIAGAHRTPAFKARDPYRHPKETLLFLGFRPNMHVAEVWPGEGWYTEILAPALRERGKYYAAHYHVDGTLSTYRKSRIDAFRDKLAKQPALYDRVAVTSINAPQHVDLAPPGSLDLVLTFRNVHNWVEEWGNEQAMFAAFHRALKPGGVLGVIEHRARVGTSMEEMKRSGYMTEAYVIGIAEKAGFRLAGKSEINANPKDTKDYPQGVWTLPPSYRLGKVDRDKYTAIGESDRMTLKFVKP